MMLCYNNMGKYSQFWCNTLKRKKHYCFLLLDFTQIKLKLETSKEILHVLNIRMQKLQTQWYQIRQCTQALVHSLEGPAIQPSEYDVTSSHCHLRVHTWAWEISVTCRYLNINENDPSKTDQDAIGFLYNISNLITSDISTRRVGAYTRVILTCSTWFKCDWYTH